MELNIESVLQQVWVVQFRVRVSSQLIYIKPRFVIIGPCPPLGVWGCMFRAGGVACLGFRPQTFRCCNQWCVWQAHLLSTSTELVNEQLWQGWNVDQVVVRFAFYPCTVSATSMPHQTAAPANVSSQQSSKGLAPLGTRL